MKAKVAKVTVLTLAGVLADYLSLARIFSSQDRLIIPSTISRFISF